MNTEEQSFSAPGPSLAMPTAGVEILSLFAAVSLAALLFVTGWLTPNQGVVLTALLLLVLLVLSWTRFNQGRHPCFLFFAMLLLLQGGRLLSYCLGSEPDPLRVRVQVNFPFDLSRHHAGTVLLCLALSSVCIYAPCRWSYRRLAPPNTQAASKYLPYLYWLFYGSLPMQMYKNYNYYQYAQEHGGYAYFWINHGEFAATVPFWVLLISVVTYPAFIGVVVLENRKKYLYLAVSCYFASSLLILLMGSRLGTLVLMIVLWYVSGIKSGKKSRVAAVLLLGFTLFLLAGIFQAVREDSESITTYAVDPLAFVTLAGDSLDVTEVVVKYRYLFAPYATTYLWNELTFGFSPHDVQHYFRGRELGHDVSVLLNVAGFNRGSGTAGSYIAEAYLIGGVTGVVVISLLIGFALHLLYRFSHGVVSLFLVMMVLPIFLSMPRGDLLDWLSVLARNTLFLLVLIPGWKIYRALVWLKQTPRPRQHPGSEPLPEHQ